MQKVSFLSGSADRLNTIAINPGQLLFTVDNLVSNYPTGHIWYDIMDGESPRRLRLSDHAQFDKDGNDIVNYYLPLHGGTLTDNLTIKKQTSATVSFSDKQNPRLTFSNGDGSQQISLIYTDNDNYQAPDSVTLVGNQSGSYFIAPNIKGDKVYGGVWNDYAEYRNVETNIPGTCVIEQGDGTLLPSTERLMGGAAIISDTFGFAIGKTEKTTTPIAVCGRVLAFPFEDKEKFQAGDAVCSGPNGTISKMTREEIKEWPDRIIGIVSEIPTYEYWGTDNIEVKGRIWITIK